MWTIIVKALSIILNDLLEGIQTLEYYPQFEVYVRV